MRKLLPHYIFLAVAVVLLVLAGLSVGFAQRSADQQRAADEEQMSQIQNDLKGVKSQIDEKHKNAVIDTSGVDIDRVERNDAQMDQILQKAMTWDSVSDYRSSRESLLEDEHLNKDDQFFTTFFPEPECNTDSSGKEYCTIDLNKLSSRYKGLSTSVMDIKGSTYTYSGTATAEVPSADGKSSVQRPVVVEYSMDTEGNITDFSAYPSTSDVKSAG